MEILKNDFRLKSAELKKKGAKIVFYTDFMKQEQTVNDDYTLNRDLEVRDAFKKAFVGIKPAIMQIMGYSDFRRVINNYKAEATEESIKVIEDTYKHRESVIRINSIKLNHWENEDKRTVQIGFSITDYQNNVININTPKVYLYKSELGFEEDLIDSIETIIDESFEYVENARTDQMEIPGFAVPEETIPEIEKKAPKIVEMNTDISKVGT